MISILEGQELVFHHLHWTKIDDSAFCFWRTYTFFTDRATNSTGLDVQGWLVSTRPRLQFSSQLCRQPCGSNQLFITCERFSLPFRCRELASEPASLGFVRYRSQMRKNRPRSRWGYGHERSSDHCRRRGVLQPFRCRAPRLDLMLAPGDLYLGPPNFKEFGRLALGSIEADFWK